MSAVENFDSLIAHARQVGNGFIFASVILRKRATPLIVVYELSQPHLRGLR